LRHHPYNERNNLRRRGDRSRQTLSLRSRFVAVDVLIGPLALHNIAITINKVVPVRELLKRPPTTQLWQLRAKPNIRGSYGSDSIE
jgi:hypothetical protein